MNRDASVEQLYDKSFKAIYPILHFTESNTISGYEGSIIDENGNAFGYGIPRFVKLDDMPAYLQNDVEFNKQLQEFKNYGSNSYKLNVFSDASGNLYSFIPNNKFATKAYVDSLIISGPGGDGSDTVIAGSAVEYVFKLSKSESDVPELNIPSDYEDVESSYQVDGYTPDGWTDHPNGISADYPVEFVAIRKKEDNIWQKFSVPAIWAKWGADGKDGDGVEYIYILTNTNDAPDIIIPDDWETNQDYQKSEYKPKSNIIDEDGNVLKWTDNYNQPNAYARYSWVAIRKFTNNRWQQYSDPKLWNIYKVAGKSYADLYKRTDNILNSDNLPIYSDSIYYRFSDDKFFSDENCENELFIIGDDNLDVDNLWNTDIPANEGKYLYRTSAFVDIVDLDAPVSITSDMWNGPFFESANGDKGERGTSISVTGRFDSSIELKDAYRYYLVNNGYITSDESLEKPEQYFKDDILNISDGYIVTDSGNLWLYSAENQGYSTFDEFFNNNWTNLGKIQGDSAYIYTAYANKDKDGNIIFTGTEAPLGKEPGKYFGVFVTDAKRENIFPNNQDQVDLFSWSKWEGEDGYGYEQIFCLSDSSIAPEIPQWADQDEFTIEQWNAKDFVPTGWSDTPLTTSSDFQYCWVATRSVPASDNTVANNFHGENTGAGYSTTAILFSRYGQDGVDGFGLQPIYKLSSTSNDVEIPQPTDDSDIIEWNSKNFVPEGWSNSPLSPTTSLRYCVIATREYPGIEDEFNIFHGEQDDNGDIEIDGIKYSKYASIYSYLAADGNDGEAVKSPILYPAGTWNKDITYVRTEEMAPYVYHKGENDEDGNYYVLVVSESINEEPTIDSSSPWQKMEKFESVYTEIGIIENGTIGEAVFNNDFMFSQTGIYNTDYSISLYKRSSTIPVLSNRNLSVDELKGDGWSEDIPTGDASLYIISAIKGTTTNTAEGIIGTEWKGPYTEDNISEFNNSRFNSTEYQLFNNENPYGENKISENKWKPVYCVDLNTGRLWCGAGNVKFSDDGSGELAGGKISWDAAGNLYFPITGTMQASYKYNDLKILGLSYSLSLNGGHFGDENDVILKAYDASGNELISENLVVMSPSTVVGTLDIKNATSLILYYQNEIIAKVDNIEIPEITVLKHKLLNNSTDLISTECIGAINGVLYTDDSETYNIVPGVKGISNIRLTTQISNEDLNSTLEIDVICEDCSILNKNTALANTSLRLLSGSSTLLTILIDSNIDLSKVITTVKDRELNYVNIDITNNGNVSISEAPYHVTYDPDKGKYKIQIILTHNKSADEDLGNAEDEYVAVLKDDKGNIITDELTIGPGNVIDYIEIDESWYTGPGQNLTLTIN